jgi:PAS domain S-box-containing protein
MESIPPTTPQHSDSDTERIRMFVSGVTDYAIYMLSPDGIVSTWNAGAQRFKGYTAEEIIGKHFSCFYTEQDRANNLPVRALQTALTNGKFEDEGWRVRKDGTCFWASVVIDPIFSDDGNLYGFAKITRDITDRKVANEALRASEERFRLLVQGVTDYAIYMLSPSGEITNWNAGAKRIKGFEHNEVVNTHFSRFYTEEDRANGLPMKALAIASSEGRFEGEGWRVRKDGSKFWAHVVIDPIRNDLGQLIGFAKITRDITERRDSAIALEHTREALFQSQKLEAIGKLTGGIAHDFNNLLSVVISGMEVLRREVQSSSSTRILESMERAADRAVTLTQQLLAFARKQPLKQHMQNINRVIGSFEAVLRRANHGPATFDLALDPTIPMVLIDAPQFEAALLNLVVNACDAMPDHGTITLSTEAVILAEKQVNSLPAGQYVKVTVRDTGSGMTPEVTVRAVEPFFTTKPIGKGTGLGLSQVYGLVQQSHGDITIESEVGRGTAISLYLPAHAHAHDTQALEVESNDKVLVVDDQPDVLDMAVELFRTLGYEVFAANNGEDAMDILQRMPDISVLFSDVVMPGISGIELGKKARALRPNLIVMLTSGYAAPVFESGGQELHEFEFMSKPYRVADVARRLRAVQQ